MEDLDQRVECEMIEQLNLHKYFCPSAYPDVIIKDHAIKLNNENHKLPLWPILAPQ